MNQGIATRALSERVKVADELGIDLRGSDEGVDLLLNGGMSIAGAAYRY